MCDIAELRVLMRNVLALPARADAASLELLTQAFANDAKAVRKAARYPFEVVGIFPNDVREILLEKREWRCRGPDI